MPIKYDRFVKKPREEVEYTEEQIEELLACSLDIFEFIKYVKIVNPDEGEIPFKPYRYQKKLLKDLKNNRHFCGLWSRQSGKSTVVAVYILWYAMFNKDKVIGIVSNKESSAKMILSRIKRMWEQLPKWIKPGVVEYSKTFITFDNGTRLVVSATTADAFRGETLNFLLCDEFAFVPSNQAEAFWAANYPTISASTESKIVIISTPNGLYNLFHRIYSKGESGLNTFITSKVTWDKVPGRNKKWAEEQIKNLGKTQFNQEFAVEFLGSTNTVIDPTVLKYLLSLNIDPIKIDMNNRLRIYEEPEKGALYVAGIDSAKGTGENSSVIQILKIESLNPVKMKQVCVFQDNKTDVYNFSEIINRLSYYYNRAYIMIENNGEGSAVVQRLWWDYENEGVVNTGTKEKNLGIRSTRTTKPKAVLLMKKLIEDGSLEVVDVETIEELGSFVEENDKFFGKSKPDDLVDALFWGTYIIEMDILDESYSFKKQEEDGDIWGILSDVEIDFEEDWSWLYDKNFTD